MTARRNLIILSTVSLLVGALGGAIATKASVAVDPGAIAQNTQPTPSAEMCQGRGPRGHRPPDFAAAAQELGVSEAELIQALGLPSEPPSRDENGRPSGPRPRLDIAGAAEELGVTEAQLVEALGIPARPPGDRPNSTNR